MKQQQTNILYVCFFLLSNSPLPILSPHADMTLSSLSRHKRSVALSDKHSSTDRLDEEDDKNRKTVAQSKKKKKRKYPITANLSGTRYDVGKFTHIFH